MAAKGRWKTDQTTSTTPEVQPATQSCARIVAQNSLITSVAALDVPKSAQDAVNPTINGNPLGSAYRKFGSKSVRPLSKGKESISMRATKNSTAPILGSSSAPVILPQDKLAASTSGMNTTDDSESRTHEGIDIGDVDQPMSDSDYVQEPKTRPNPEPKVPARPQAKTKPGVGRKKVDPSGNLPAGMCCSATLVACPADTLYFMQRRKRGNVSQLWKWTMRPQRRRRERRSPSRKIHHWSRTMMWTWTI
jgi:hypothetical protein